MRQEEEERQERQRQLERQRRDLLQLQLQQQEHWQRRQILQWQLKQQQQRRSPPAILSPSSGLCTIYEAMETSEEEEEEEVERDRNMARRLEMTQRPLPPQYLEWGRKVDMVQQLINQTLLLSGDGGCPPLLLLPMGTGGTLSPLESSLWPSLLPPLITPSATVTSISSFSPDSQGSSPPGDWTVVELETQH